MATVTASRPRAKLARFADRDVDPPLAASANKDRQFVIALARGLDVLRAFTPQDGLLGNHEIAARTGLPVTEAATAWADDANGYLAKAEQVWDEYHDSPWVNLRFAPQAPYSVEDSTL